MSLAGRQWVKDHNQLITDRARKVAKLELWGHPDEMLIDFLSKALDSGMFV